LALHRVRHEAEATADWRLVAASRLAGTGRSQPAPRKHWQSQWHTQQWHPAGVATNPDSPCHLGRKRPTSYAAQDESHG
jgi:hypothetical protein